MNPTLKQFAAECHDILKADPGPDGREQVRLRLEKLLLDDAFLATCCGPDAETGADILYEDEELGFQILAHVMNKGHTGGAHDHGESWAIYGQAAEYTDMTEWRRLDDGGTPGKADIEIDREYRLERGMAGIFADGAIHSISYPDGARFIRITGVDLSTIARGRYNPAEGTMAMEKREIFRGAEK